MRDVYPITVLVGYQFAMRWMNAHIFYVKKGSPLSKRILDITRTMPLNHPEFTTTIVDKVGLSLSLACSCRALSPSQAPILFLHPSATEVRGTLSDSLAYFS